MNTEINNRPYTYVFIRNDLSYAQQIVQASHATLEAGFKFEQPEEISSIVLFPLNNEKDLFDKARYLREHGIEHEMFYEPDINQYTAIATRAMFGEEREIFSELRTYRPKADKKWPKRFQKLLDYFDKKR